MSSHLRFHPGWRLATARCGSPFPLFDDCISGWPKMRGMSHRLVAKPLVLIWPFCRRVSNNALPQPPCDTRSCALVRFTASFQRYIARCVCKPGRVAPHTYTSGSRHHPIHSHQVCRTFQNGVSPFWHLTDLRLCRSPEPWPWHSRCRCSTAGDQRLIPLGARVRGCGAHLLSAPIVACTAGTNCVEDLSQPFPPF